ncbi:hypothetical protein B0H19DRAFT_1074487 [Mycena capillaripes]|nr:hypothetical protein B0H19DRAFT_1074487 [Mycena capillaripes]
MPRAPTRFNDAAQEEQYYAPESTTVRASDTPFARCLPSMQWNSASTSSYLPMGFQTMAHPQYTGPSPQFPGPLQFPGSSSQLPPLASHNYNQAQISTNRQQFQRMPSAGHMPPPAFQPNQTPRAPTQIDSRPPDYWHSNKHLMCVNRGTKLQFPHSVSYRPTSGPCTFGVAMLNLEYGRGMVAPNEQIDEFMPPCIMKYANGALLLDWPGYRQENFVLRLIDQRTGRHVTRAALGAQATQIFKDFIHSRKESDFTDADGAMRLGVDGVSYDQVRLVELYTKDGMSYRPQYALNAHFLAVDV